jgi:hypothetical protein
MGVNNLVNTIAELRQVIPDRADIKFIRQRAIDSGVVGQQLLGDLQRLEFLLPNARDLQAVSNLDPVSQQRIIDGLLVQFQDMPSKDEIRGLAEAINEDRIDRREFIREVSSIVDAIPTGRPKNIIEDEIGSTSSSSSADDDLERRISKREADDRRTAQNLLNIKGDPSILTPTQKLIYAQLAGITRVAPTKEQMSSIIGDRGSVSGQTLRSSIGLEAASLKEIQETIKTNPDIAGSLINITTGQPVDYRDISLKPPASAKSRKVAWRDTNLNELLRAKFGKGLKGKISPNIKLKVGRGLAVKETPSYREYGKYAIHIPQLEQQDILNVKYKSLGQIPKFKPIPVSDIFRDFVLDLIENGKPNARVYTQICPNERKFFEEMSIGAGIWNSLGLKRTTTSTDEEENKRFELLKGEYVAGNNSPKVISELRKLVVKMMSDGRIRKNQGVELLMELSI